MFARWNLPKVAREVIKAVRPGTKFKGQKTAKELMATNEKSLQRVMDRGGYNPNDPNTKAFLHSYRKQTTKKILKQNKPEGKK